jgi:hypothetical protein
MGAAIGGSYAAITGGDIKRGILTGAISGAAFGLAGGLIESFAMSAGEQALLHAVAGGVSGGINSAVTGGDVGMGIVTSAVSAGTANYVGGFFQGDFAIQFLSQTAIGGLSGGVTSAVVGGSFQKGMVGGVLSSSYGFFCNQVAHQLMKSAAESKYHKYEEGIWSGNVDVDAQLGQAVQISVTNINVLGTTIEINALNIKQTEHSLLLPYHEKKFKFYRFGSEPYSWNFRIRSESDVFLVRYKITSTWVPGMPRNE